MHVGVIGVGHIGNLFVDSLLASGHDVTAFDIDERKIAAATDRGASAADSPRDVGERSDAVVLALPGTPEVEAVFERDGLLAGLDPDDLVVDASTTLPATSVACEGLCDERGVDFVEAPITGAAPREGHQMLVGATEAHYERATPLLDALCDAHVRIGPVPDGTRFKLALQVRYAVQAAVDAEVVAFARDSGLNPSILREFLHLDVDERYIDREFEQAIDGMGGRAIWQKDVGYALQVAAEQGSALPLASVVYEAYKATDRHASEKEGHATAILRYWELLNGANG
jgi:3-hydroxyisobutyrate dehydrogenase-like beta-hydroxyacid dehydrogenase